jgi:hypothetical protein
VPDWEPGARGEVRRGWPKGRRRKGEEKEERKKKGRKKNGKRKRKEIGRSLEN